MTPPRADRVADSACNILHAVPLLPFIAYHPVYAWVQDGTFLSGPELTIWFCLLVAIPLPILVVAFLVTVALSRLNRFFLLIHLLVFLDVVLFIGNEDLHVIRDAWFPMFLPSE